MTYSFNLLCREGIAMFSDSLSQTSAILFGA